MADKYILRITAGPTYDEASQVEIPVNQPTPVHIKSDNIDVELNVRIQGYRGLPRDSPSTSPYFSTEPHAYNQDQYSISFKFTPLKPSSQVENSAEGGEDTQEAAKGIKGTDLQFGNDFDRPIRERLPPGFSTAMSIVKWWVDPGLDGDAYADKPYLYGPALSSFNVLSVGGGSLDESKGGLWFEEGGDDAGMEARAALGVPKDSKARMKWALTDANREKWIWEYGTTYGIDFYNPYLDFANLALRLPGFQLACAKYLDRKEDLRYVLRNKSTGETYLVIVFSLYLVDDVNEDGTIKKPSELSTPVGVLSMDGSEESEVDEEKALREAREKLGPAEGEGQTESDDLD